MCSHYKVEICARIISLAEGPFWPTRPLPGGRHKWQLWDSYNCLGLCDSLAPKRA